MKRASLMLAMMLTLCMGVNAQKVKNVILMIPDGCSLPVLSLSRWLKRTTDPQRDKNLNIDPYICGTVITTCSNAPIGDSAPTTSCYMTGYPQLAGWVATYPLPHPDDDIYPIDPDRAYQPLTTLLEAARIKFHKSVGLVCTCEFPQATPADCSSHSYNRSKYDWITSQQAHNNIDVLIGGGTKLLKEEDENYLKENGWTVLKDDKSGMEKCMESKMWALFGDQSMAYEADRKRNKDKEPSLAEMTEVAISKLSECANGFFLMVEGSKIDWAAHNNDLRGMVDDFAAFDQACKVALDFAKKDGNTAVVIVPDHGNSGLSIGRRDMSNYAGKTMRDLFGNLENCHLSADGLADKINSIPFSDVQKLMQAECGFKLTDKELEFLKNCKEYKQSPIPEEERKQASDGTLYSTGLSRTLAQFITARTGMAFTTNGHTGEEVFLAAYHPQAEHRPYGVRDNVELNAYLCSLYGITRDTLDCMTNELFAPHNEVFGENCSIKKVNDVPTLTAKVGRHRLTITPNTNVILVDRKQMTLESVIVYVDKNNTFYVPRSLGKL